MSPKPLVLSFALTLVVLGLAPAASGQGSPMGNEFQVNEYTTYYQAFADVSGAPGQGFVVVWHGYGSLDDTSDYGVLGRLYDESGTAVTGEFQVNASTPGYQGMPAVSMAGDGSFVVVWNGATAGDTFGIAGQLFSSAGAPLGEFRVNTLTSTAQAVPRVARAADDRFVVVWHSDATAGNDTFGSSIQARLYSSAGVPSGAEVQVNTYTPDLQREADVAMADDGRFVVVWGSATSAGGDASGTSVQMRRFDSDGNPVASDFQVNTYVDGNQNDARVAMTNIEGDFVVVWSSFGSPGSDIDGYSVQARLFHSDGTPDGGQFQVNSYTTSFQWGPAVVMDEASGKFYVLWFGETDLDASDSGISGQAFSSAGSPLGEDFLVNAYTTSVQSHVAAAFHTATRFVVTWDGHGSAGTDTDYTSVHSRRFEDPLFMDGFESGDTSAWSLQVP